MRNAIVTKEFLISRLRVDPSLVIGRALVAIFQYQTEEERSSNVAKLNNGVGFTQADARIGCIGAKYYLKHGKMEDWQIKNWMLPNKRGEPRIVKYAGQLDHIAKQRLLENQRP